ncbi:MAG: glycosyltransferase family 4 protein [Planctomycetota bacterium]
MTPISDALVVILDERSTLAGLERAKRLRMVWTLWETLAEGHGRLLVVTHGGAEDARLAQERGVTCVCNIHGLLAYEHLEHAAMGVATELRGCATAVVQTTDFTCGPLGSAVCAALDHAGVRVGHVAVGSDLSSRQQLYEFGPTSRAAREAAFREHAACRNAHVVVAGCDPVANDLIWRFNLPEERVRIIPSCVVAERIPVATESRPGNTFVAFGPATKRSRLDVAIESVALMRQTDLPDAELTILGEGPETPRLRALAEERSVPTRFEKHFRGEEIVEAIANATVGLYTGANETHPRPVFEAMALATPIVLAADPMCALEITHGVTGIRMTCEPEAIARALSGLAMDAPWRDTLGRTGRERILREHGLKGVSDGMHEAHRAALDAAGQDTAITLSGLILASEAVGELPAAQAAQAWAGAIRDHVERLGPWGTGHLEAIRDAVERLCAESADLDRRSERPAA